MSNDHPKQDWAGTLLLLAGLGLSGFLFLKALPTDGWPRQQAVAAFTTNSVKQVERGYRNIEDIEIGDRVVTKLSAAARRADPILDPATSINQVDRQTWKLLRMQAETVSHDGTVDDVNIKTLQSPEWIAFHKAVVGKQVPIPLDLVEMGLPEGLQAQVLAIESCPPIENGPGRIVLTTVNHFNNYVFDLTTSDYSGAVQTIGVTGFHKFFSVSRNAWVSTKDLQKGELLDGISGLVSVSDLQRRLGTHRVYNLSVERDHVYRVSHHGVLVHNSNCYTFASEMADELPGGQTFVIGQAYPGMIQLPGYPVAGYPSINGDQALEHAVYQYNGYLWDPAHPQGVPYSQWQQQFYELNLLYPENTLNYHDVANGYIPPGGGD